MFDRLLVKRRKIPVLVTVIVVAGAGFAYVYQRNHSSTGPLVSVNGQSKDAESIPNRPAYKPDVIADQADQLVIGDYVLHIDKLDVNVPMVSNVNGLNQTAYFKALESGVAHYKGTPLPGKGNGNTFIFGHSSYYANKPGNYKEVFKALGTLKTGDTFTITHKQETYTYKTYVSKLTTESDGSVLNETKDEVVTLMTCWPPGTYVKRWVVQARRVK